ncbi:MAG: UDP-N-acetylglucosamine--N-acetylmuramyl-(pentapeptide) pyrophosphoryl-undecaprenol N-acetylglucosamine transferase [Acidobacteria bacterium]|nr:UDP-N-acetylglucosamine--N-acetylmuramyl-(pentapeptide) pyrophosphoryl-undecaprenol N-acetylglucosamine transferase [Acidobacteriota bacterium]
MNLILLFAVIIILSYLSLLVIAIIKRKGSANRAVLTGGGSSGHIYPAIAIGKALQPEVDKFLYIGGKGRIEEKVVPKEGIPLKLISAMPYPSAKIQLPLFLLRLLLGIAQSSLHLFLFQPYYVIGTGGFVSAPVIFSAFLMGKFRLLKSQIFLHEQNVTPGKLNIIASEIADKILVTFPHTLLFFGKKATLIGYPVRKFSQQASADEILNRLNIPKGRKIIFAFGGSQGSRTINRGVVASLKNLLPFKDQIFIILSCGLGQSEYDGKKDVEEQLLKNYSKKEIAEINQFFRYEPYFFNVDEIFKVASLVIARSGAGTLFELSSFGLPSILIPKLGLSNEHQVMNAMALEELGAAKIIFEKPSFNDHSILAVEGSVLSKAILDIIFSDDSLERMRSGAMKLISCPDPLNAIRKIVLMGECQEEEAIKCSPFYKLKPPSALLSYIQKAKEKDGFKIENLFKESEINFYKSLTLKLLFSSDWREKNIGVKLAAFFPSDETKRNLVEIVTNREEAPFLQKILGEKCKYNGFLRRNSLFSLKEYILSDEELDTILEYGFSDHYYEARVAALQLAQNKSQQLSKQKEIISRIKKLANDKEYEVAKEALILLGKIGGEEEVLFMLSFKNHFFWQVREASLIAIREIIERKIPIDKEELISGLRKFNLTATDYKPLFTIKQNYNKIFEILEKN